MSSGSLFDREIDQHRHGVVAIQLIGKKPSRGKLPGVGAVEDGKGTERCLVGVRGMMNL